MIVAGNILGERRLFLAAAVVAFVGGENTNQ
jgi:hypothetical protein